MVVSLCRNVLKNDKKYSFKKIIIIISKIWLVALLRRVPLSWVKEEVQES